MQPFPPAKVCAMLHSTDEHPMRQHHPTHARFGDRAEILPPEPDAPGGNAFRVRAADGEMYYAYRYPHPAVAATVVVFDPHCKGSHLTALSRCSVVAEMATARHCCIKIKLRDYRRYEYPSAQFDFFFDRQSVPKNDNGLAVRARCYAHHFIVVADSMRGDDR